MNESLNSLVSRETFLRDRVLPANGNDRFNDNTCVFCWDDYNDEDHHGVRVLPCNHVFGKKCLLEAVKAPYGYKCPLCQTKLFRPSILVSPEEAIAHYVLSWVVFFAHRWFMLPPGLRILIHFFLRKNDFYYHLSLLLSHCIGMRARNPGLNHITYQAMFVLFVGYFVAAVVNAVVGVSLVGKMTIVFLHVLYIQYRQVRTFEDRSRFLCLAIMALIMNFALNTFWPRGTIWPRV